MSSVCSSWLRSSASALAVDVGPTDGEQAEATASSSPRKMRGTMAMLTSDDAALAPGGDARVLRCADERHDAAALDRCDSVRGGRDHLADAERKIVTNARADGSRGVRRRAAAGGGRRDDGDGLLRRRCLLREPRDGAVH